MSLRQPGYMGKLLRVNLTTRQITEDVPDEATLRQYLGGIGLATKYLYEEVPAGVGWSDPENRLLLATGPLAGTRVMGSSNLTVATKGPLTDGATSTQANGFFAAYLRFCGYDGLIVQGRAQTPAYLYVGEDGAEVRDARRLAGKDTLETGEALRQEAGQRHVSVLAIGPAGENGVRFAGIIGDGGHAACHNGVGAVMGSKNLKAIVVPRGKRRPEVHDKEKLSHLAKSMFEAVKEDGWHSIFYRWGTSNFISSYAARGLVSVRNYQSSVFPQHADFAGPNVRARFEIKPEPCWGCRMIHCHRMKVTDGPYAGYEAEEPELTGWLHWGANVGVTDPGTVVMLTDVSDRLGVEIQETAMIVAWVMECYEKELISSQDLGGLQLTWGNAEAVRALLHMIALRQGYGAVLAEGLKRAAESRGGAARDCAVYTLRGNNTTAKDQRVTWSGLADQCLSNTGTYEAGHLWARPDQLGIEPVKDPFSPEQVSTNLAQIKGSFQFYDSLGVCVFTTAADVRLVVDMLNAATGWDFTVDEAMQVGRRAVNLMRVFNLRHGLTADQERPSARLGAAPNDGPVKGISIMPHWDYIRRNYYNHMGWDADTCRPLPETLRSLGLEHTVAEVWGPQAL